MDPNQTVVNRASHTPYITNISNGSDSNSPILKDLETEESGNNEHKNEISHNFTINIYKDLKISIYKPLIPLRIALFLWYGGSDVFTTFLLVSLKQRDISLGELSNVYIISPVFQILGTVVSGFIADKLGRSKPVLVVNLLLVAASGLGLLLAPSTNVTCDPEPIKLKCHPQEFGLIAKANCDVTMDVIELSSCNVTCPINVTHYCNEHNLICELLEGNENFDNFSLAVHINFAYELKNKCYYNVTSIYHKNVSYSWCNVAHEIFCRIFCLTKPDEDCSYDNSSPTKVFILYMTLIVLFFMCSSNCFRFMDVTSMSLVKDHNSFFGREQFFAIAGVFICTPLVGYIIDKTTAEGSDKNYSVTFIFFIGIICSLLIVIYKLEVKIKAPGQNMWKKSLYLLKNPDVIAFILVLIVLGTARGFTKQFTSWYLEGMKAPSFLLGLLSAVSALYGLPFLFTSKWWVKKIGANQIIILGLLGYVASGIGYSLLYNPWLALLIEATSIATYYLLWVAVIVHSHNIAPEGLTATVISSSGGIHFSLGKCSGGFIGGQIMNAFGGRAAYRVMAIGCLTYAVLHIVYLCIRKMCFTRNRSLAIRNGPESVSYDKNGTSQETYVMQK